MTSTGVLLVGFVMLLGLAGILIPVVPGLVLVWGGVLVWALIEGGSTAWTVLGVASVLAVVGGAASYLLPARAASSRGAPASSLLPAAVGAVGGFLLIPVVGFALGGLGVLLLAEYRRLGEWGPAWRSSRAALVAVGVGMVVELAAGLLIVGVWVVGVVTS